MPKVKKLTKIEKPAEIVLRFKSKAEKEYFMAGLSDGFGENQCSLEWTGDFDRAKVFLVEPWHEEVYDE